MSERCLKTGTKTFRADCDCRVCKEQFRNLVSPACEGPTERTTIEAQEVLCITPSEVRAPRGRPKEQADAVRPVGPYDYHLIEAPSTFINCTVEASDEKVREVEAEVMAKYVGAKDADKIVTLPQGAKLQPVADWQPLADKLNEWRASSEKLFDYIVSCFGIPRELLTGVASSPSPPGFFGPSPLLKCSKWIEADEAIRNSQYRSGTASMAGTPPDPADPLPTATVQIPPPGI